MYIQIVGGRIYTPTGWIDGGSVLVEGKKIKAILNTDLPIEGARQLDARGSYIIPGGIEMHVHGAAGADYMDGTVEAFRTASDYHLQQGTTTIFPTLSTSSYETIMKGIECTEILMKDDESHRRRCPPRRSLLLCEDGWCSAPRADPPRSSRGIHEDHGAR